MQFILFVTGPAYGTQNARSAYLFAQKILSCNLKHRLDLIFFYGEGIYNANRYCYPSNDEFDIVRAWYRMNLDNGVPLHVCSSAAMRRGVGKFANRKTLEVIDNIETGFTICGLGSLVMSILKCDRLIQF
ncbi:MAG: sulfurtransferase complex subunit TusD [Candidatus Dasytiphilus stammeri]